MKRLRQRHAPFQSAIKLVVVSVLAAVVGSGLPNDQWVRELIDNITKPTPLEAMGLRGCGSIERDRVHARAIVALGGAAIPELEKAMSSILSFGERSPFAYNSGWLLLSSARIQGAKSFPRLKQLARSKRLEFLGHEIDRAIALSLGITSYISLSRVVTLNLFCHRSMEPRDALDQLILGWGRGDLTQFESSLGPRAKSIFEGWKGGRDWSAFRTEFGLGAPDLNSAVGYRLLVRGRWAEPEETLEQNRELGDSLPLSEQGDFEVIARFLDADGKVCGTRPVRFVRSTIGNKSLAASYKIDNTDLKLLLGQLNSCIATSIGSGADLGKKRR